jgi:hypothetical protein
VTRLASNNSILKNHLPFSLGSLERLTAEAGVVGDSPVPSIGAPTGAEGILGPVVRVLDSLGLLPSRPTGLILSHGVLASPVLRSLSCSSSKFLSSFLACSLYISKAFVILSKLYTIGCIGAS